MFKRLLIASASLAASLTMAAAAPTNPVSVGSSDWTSIGCGPMEFAAPGAPAGAILYVVAPAKPSLSVAGRPVPQAPSLVLSTTECAWALSSAGTQTVLTGPLSMATPALSEGTIAPDGGRRVHLSNWPGAPLPGSGQHNLGVSSPTALTVPPGAIYAAVCASTATVRYTTDGTAPTASIGMPLAASSCIALTGPDLLSAFRAYSATGTLDIEYYR